MGMKLTPLLAPITLALLSTTGHADVMPATMGHPWTPGGPIPNPSTCFFNPGFDGIGNACSTSQLWIVPVQVDVSANKQVSFSAVGGNSGNDGVVCKAFSISFDGTQFSSTSNGSNILTTPKTVSLGIIGVPAHGTLHFECTLGTPNARLFNVEFQ